MHATWIIIATDRSDIGLWQSWRRGLEGPSKEQETKKSFNLNSGKLNETWPQAARSYKHPDDPGLMFMGRFYFWPQ